MLFGNATNVKIKKKVEMKETALEYTMAFSLSPSGIMLKLGVFTLA